MFVAAAVAAVVVAAVADVVIIAVAEDEKGGEAAFVDDDIGDSILDGSSEGVAPVYLEYGDNKVRRWYNDADGGHVVAVVVGGAAVDLGAEIYDWREEGGGDTPRGLWLVTMLREVE